MYNYKLTEYDLADQIINQMKRDKNIKKTFDKCVIFFSIFIIGLIMVIIKNVIPEVSFIVLGGVAIILITLLTLILIKNYRFILALVFRRSVTKKSDSYDITLEILGRKLKVYRKESEEEFNINEIRCEEQADTTYVYYGKRIIIIPDRIFKSEEEKKEFIKKIKNDK